MSDITPYGPPPFLPAPPPSAGTDPLAAPALPSYGGGFPGGAAPTVPGAPAIPGGAAPGDAYALMAAQSPSAQRVQDLQGQIAGAYASIPPRNFAAERRGALLAGAIGLLGGALTGNAAVALGTGGAAAHGFEQGAAEAYQNRMQMAQWRASQLMQQEQIAARMVSPELRAAASYYHTNQMAQNQGAQAVLRDAQGFPQWANQLRTAYPNLTDTELGAMAQARADDITARAQALGLPAPNLPVGRRVVGTATANQGTTPDGVRWTRDPETGDMAPLPGQTGADGLPLTGGVVPDANAPGMASARPPVIEMSAPSLPPDTTKADAALRARQAGSVTLADKLRSLTPQAQQTLLAGMDAQGLLDGTPFRKKADGTYPTVMAAPPLKAQMTPEERAVEGQKALAQAREQIGMLPHAQQVEYARRYNATFGDPSNPQTFLAVPGEPSGQVRTLPLANGPGTKQFPILNPDYGPTPLDQSHIAATGHLNAETANIPVLNRFKQEQADAEQARLALSQKSVGIAAAALGLRQQEFQNRLQQQAAGVGTGSLRGDPSRWSAEQLQREIAQMSPNPHYAGKGGFVPVALSPERADYIRDLQALRDAKLSAKGIATPGADLSGLPGLSGMTGGGGFTIGGNTVSFLAPPSPAPPSSLGPVRPLAAAPPPAYQNPPAARTNRAARADRAPVAGSGTRQSPYVVRGAADYANVAPGAYFTAPDGKLRQKKGR